VNLSANTGENESVDRDKAAPHAPVFDRNFRQNKQAYILQAAMAGAALLLLMVMQSAVTNAAVITGIAASVFLAMLYPSSKLAQPRRLVGGHTVGVGVGLAFRLLADTIGREALGGILLPEICAALAVAAGIFIMGVTDTEHPPAAGTLLGMIFGSQVIAAGAMLIASAAALSAVQHLLRRRLIDLL
jgi:CBS-domain-containing membrane protein